MLSFSYRASKMGHFELQVYIFLWVGVILHVLAFKEIFDRIFCWPCHAMESNVVNVDCIET